ncbi:MAG: hypothetical protein JXA15_05025 [Spirochaetales bacterium]|nr:hypothetical protein [Spirochaetales bacterium]
MGMTDLALAPAILPLVGAALALAGKTARPASARTLERLGAFVGLALPWLPLVLLAPSILQGGAVEGFVGGWAPSVGVAFRFDGMAWLVNLLGFAVAGPAWVHARGSGPRGSAFTALYLVQASALAATSMAADLFNLFVCLEVLGMASYVLVTESGKPGAYLASFSYLMVSAAAMVFFLLGVYGLYRLTGALEYGAVARGLSALPDSGGHAALASVAAIAAAIALRTAVMPLYGWLPEAHALAPHAVSAVLSGVLIKTPLFALTRILVLLPGGGETGAILGAAGAIAAPIGVVIALSQTDAKRLLAYHSISQIGYVVAAWGAGVALIAADPDGAGASAGAVLVAAAYLHALAHALFKGLLFLSVGTVTDVAAERDVYRLRGAGRALRRAGERLPVTTLAFAVGALSIMAIPPFNGYASKAALSAALKGRWQYWTLLAASVGTVASFIKLSLVFRRPKPAASTETFSEEAPPAVADTATEAPESGAEKVPISAKLATATLAAACLAGGLAAPRLYRVVATALGAAPGATDAWSAALYAPAELLKTAGLAAGGLALFALARTAPGKALASAIRNRPRGFHGLFLALCLGMAALTAWLIR